MKNSVSSAVALAFVLGAAHGASAADSAECKAVKHAYDLKRAERMAELEPEVKGVKWIVSQCNAEIVSSKLSHWVQAYRESDLRHLPADRPDLADPVKRRLEKQVLDTIRVGDPDYPQSIMFIPNPRRSSSEAPDYYSQFVTDFSKIGKPPVVRYCVFYVYRDAIRKADSTDWTAPKDKLPLACVDFDLATGKMTGRDIRSAIANAFNEAGDNSSRRDVVQQFQADLAEYSLTPQRWRESKMTGEDKRICDSDTVAARETPDRDAKRVAAPASPGPASAPKPAGAVRGVEPDNGDIK